MNRTTLWGLAALGALTGLSVGPSRAEDVAFQRTPLANAIARMDKIYGVNIVLRGPLAKDPLRRVTLTVDGSDTPSARFGAVTDLADALNATAVKGFVVTKTADTDAFVSPKLDVSANVVFKSTTVSVTEAIQKIAEVDGATAQIAKDITGTVTFPGVKMRAQAAADEVARQAHLRWKAYYALVRSDQVAETPFVYYGTLNKTPPPVPTTTVTAPANGTVGQPTNATALAIDPATGLPVGGTIPPGYLYSYAPNPYLGYGYGGGAYPIQGGGVSPYGPYGTLGGNGVGGSNITLLPGASPYFLGNPYGSPGFVLP